MDQNASPTADGASAHADTDWIGTDAVPGLVSVVIPTCNRSEILMETLDSIVTQGFRPIQVVVVDDDSTDDTEARVQELKSRLPDGMEILYLKQDKAGGPAARNRGACRASGEFLVFMDDDDVFSKNFFSSHMETLRLHPEANLAWCRWQRFRREGDHYLVLDNKGEYPATAASPWEAFLLGWELLLQSCVLRRDLVREVGPWKLHLKKSQDLDYKARLLAADCRLVETQGANVFYRLHVKSVTGQLDDAKVVSYVEALDDIESIALERPDYQALRNKLADYLWGHSFWLYGQARAVEGLSTLNQAKRHDPAVSMRNGPWPSRLLARCGLDRISGTLLLKLFKLKTRLMGKKDFPVLQRVSELPR